MRSLHIAIDRIVVDGLPASARRDFVVALQETLCRLAASGIPQSLANDTYKTIDILTAGRLPPAATPAQAATRVANSIWSSLAATGSQKAFSRSGPSSGAGAHSNV